MKRFLICGTALWLAFAAQAQTFTVASPDGRQQADLMIGTDDGATRIRYATRFDGREVIQPSALDLTIDNHLWEKATGKRNLPTLTRWFDNLHFAGCDTLQRDTTWHNRFGERSTVRDAYHGLIVHFIKDDGSKCRLDIEVRAYDEGIALRYVLPMHPDALYHRVKAENTEFTLPEGTQVWFAQWAQAQYQQLGLDEWPDEAERPLTLELPGGLYAALGEAAQIDFPRGKFALSKNKRNTIVTALNDDATDLVTPYALPWRVIMVADRLGALLENNDIYLNLNQASQIADTDWIKPGKIMRETTLTTENSIASIAFCKRHKIDYILYDWLWYGPSFDFASDAREVVAPIDMLRVINYGRQNGVGVWVYVNQHALQKQAAEIFPLYEKWGLKGIKFGFVQFTSQHWADWVHRTVRLAADSHLMVNIHDEYRPTGYSRTYPNLLTQEGICGNEEFPLATHNTILPFTRMLSGAGDYTVCYFDPRIKNTHAHQLAFPVIFFSPLQTLYWYDTPKRIVEVPELEFFDNVPTVWDETRVLDDAIGHHVVIARRSGKEWFIGAIAGEEACQIEIPTSMLTAGGDYLLRVYTDDDTVTTPTHVRAARYRIKGGQSLNFALKARGGAALHLSPLTFENAQQKRLKKNQIL